MAPHKNAFLKIIFSIFQPKHVVGTQKSRLNETVLLSTQNIFSTDKKIITTFLFKKLTNLDPS